MMVGYNGKLRDDKTCITKRYLLKWEKKHSQEYVKAKQVMKPYTK